MNEREYHRYRVAMRLLSPMVAGTGMDAQNHRLTQEHIPGGVLRGSLGARLYREKGKFHSPIKGNVRAGDSDLDRIFGSGGIRFGPLYPVSSDDDSGDEPWGHIYDSIVIPQTAFTCKAHPGLWVRSGGGHITVDLAFHTRRDLAKSLVCKCGGRLERIRGYATLQAGIPDTWVKANPKLCIRMRVGLNRQSATAEEGILHSMQLVQPPRLMMGFWSMTAEQHDILVNALAPFREGAGFVISVGAGQSRGLGQGVLYIADSPERNATMAFPEAEGGLRYFTITARSPLLVLDDAGIPRTILSPEVIRRYYPDAPPFTLRENGCYAESELASGWSGMWGLPKPVCNCIGAGSVFVYESRVSDDEMMPFFKEVMTRGLGERLEEGFGQVDINHRFHLDFSPEEGE